MNTQTWEERAKENTNLKYHEVLTNGDTVIVTFGGRHTGDVQTIVVPPYIPEQPATSSVC